MNTQKYCYFVKRKLLRIAQKNFVNTSNQIFQSVKQHRKKNIASFYRLNIIIFE